jgi:hypothetical protein
LYVNWSEALPQVMKPGRSGLRMVLRLVCSVFHPSPGALRTVGAHLSSKLNDLGIDRHDPVVTGHGYTKVAVSHEVRVADLVVKRVDSSMHLVAALPDEVRVKIHVVVAPPLLLRPFLAPQLRTQLWRAAVGGGSAEVPIWGVHVEMGINAHTRGSLQRAGVPTKGESEEETQTRPCSMAKRVAAVRELTPSLW